MTTDIITELHSAATKLLTSTGNLLPRQDMAIADLLGRAANAIEKERARAAKLNASIDAARGRADYWRRRAKSAEGHLLSSDVEPAARSIHAAIPAYTSCK